MQTHLQMPPLTVADKDRFWSKVYIPDNKDECWVWKDVLDKDGYGKFKSVESYRAHRVSYFINYGIDPNNKLVLHSCDNPSCVNPNHLFIGTSKDNRIDCVIKGRANSASGDSHGMNTRPERRTIGVKNGMSKLTGDEVLKIRELSAAGVLQKDIANDYGVHIRYISLITNRRRWKHLLPKEIVTPKISYAFGFINA